MTDAVGSDLGVELRVAYGRKFDALSQIRRVTLLSRLNQISAPPSARD
jgi:hypothetical protein